MKWENFHLNYKIVLLNILNIEFVELFLIYRFIFFYGNYPISFFCRDNTPILKKAYLLLDYKN